MGIETPKFEGPDPYETKQEQQESRPEILKKGDQVEVLRSSGEKDSGWSIEGFDEKTGAAVVRKQEGKDILEKRISQIELYALNRKEGETRRFSVGEWIRFYGGLGVEAEFSGKAFESGELTPEEARKLAKARINSNTLEREKRDNEEEMKIIEKRRRALLGY